MFKHISLRWCCAKTEGKAGKEKQLHEKQKEEKALVLAMAIFCVFRGGDVERLK